MPPSSHHLFLPEASARRILLAHSIDSQDTEGRLVNAEQRAGIEARALLACKQAAHASQLERTRGFLESYADGMLDTASSGSSGSGPVQAANSLQRWGRTAAVGLPLLAWVMGVLTDQVANPHRVDLLSLPLLAVVLWNLLVYVLIAARFVWARLPGHTGQKRPGLVPSWQGAGAGLRRWLHPRSSLHNRVLAHYWQQWQATGAALHTQRLTRVLHLAAAAWGLGLAVSLLSRGLVVEYRAGWESTFLDAAQVQGFLNTLFWPVATLLALPPFSLAEIASLRFDAATPLAHTGSRWAWLYAGILMLAVVLPRLGLAALASWRLARLTKAVPLNLAAPGFQRLLDAALPVRLLLAVHTHHSPLRAALLHVLLQGAPVQSTAGTLQTPHRLIQTTHGDELLLSEVAAAALEPADSNRALAEPGAALRWPMVAMLGRWIGRTAVPDEPQRDMPDLVLDLDGVGAPPAAGEQETLLNSWAAGVPVLTITQDLVAASAAPGAAPAAPPGPASLAWESFGPSWVQEQALWARITPLLPASHQAGLQRLALAWEGRNQARFANCMAAIAGHLMLAAQQIEKIAPLSLKNRLLKYDDRRAHEAAIEAARVQLAQRVDESAARLRVSLWELHGLTAPPPDERQRSASPALFGPRSMALQPGLAGGTGAAAGAAAGATLGAHLDILTLGATLGAGAALGALVGGGAALAALVWNNTGGFHGEAVVELSDTTLLALLEASLLHYLEAAHAGREPPGEPPGSASDARIAAVAVAASAVRDTLQGHWQAARAARPENAPTRELASRLESVARELLQSLYPG